jgi:hypothetical protein
VFIKSLSHLNPCRNSSSKKKEASTIFLKIKILFYTIFEKRVTLDPEFPSPDKSGISQIRKTRS